MIEMAHVDDEILASLGMSFPKDKFSVEKIMMYYSSFRRRFLPDFIVDSWFREKAKEAVEKDAILGIGLISTGIYGDEPVYDLDTLKKEIKIASRVGVKEVVIFRLEGFETTEG